ncbi:hypothetical protein AOL_s00054g122 [Orbilia oligospora ATCC 24927]|uniref:C2H2-type domain-containing protein n=1 Tax=Arthrobotrys oligospora (strain ATCC 24927 / CBS 115.81 / DSM 1491) TaxID=756982 RepID=G1X5H8_ARTOA|nr:hypothetical protein AOL_s00054g122 [Orbilia oligospora ATCC 24927]EGX51423.1 hypothetical protein AOL_s00054g122 [Orbilia oligospora ATCC 24927]
MEGLGDFGDSLMTDFDNRNHIPLLPEDFDIDTWLTLSTFTAPLPESELIPEVNIPISNNFNSDLELDASNTLQPAYDLGQAGVDNYTLTKEQSDLLSFIEAFPFNTQEGYPLQLEDLGGPLAVSENSPSSHASNSRQEIPEPSVILERYVNASSEDESEAPFSAIERHISNHTGMSPHANGPESPISLEITRFMGFEADPMVDYDATDGSSLCSNTSNVSHMSRANCLRALGRLAIDADFPITQTPNRTPSICSIRSSSSLASDACSIRTSTTSTSSRAPSRRKRTMTNNHKTSRRASKSENRFFCTFCGTSFSTKSTWKRHEESIHLMLKTWTCSPHGIIVSMQPKNVLGVNATKALECGYNTCWFCNIDKETTNVPFSFGQNHSLQTSRDVPDRFTSMTCFSLEQHCFSHPNSRTCHENSVAEKTFIRFDHFARHLRDAHNIDGLKTTFEASHESKEDPLHGVFQVLPGPANSRCGFCGETFSTWSDRVHHISHEFWWKKRKMEEWTGDWGFDREWMDRLQDARLPEDFTSSGRSESPEAIVAGEDGRMMLDEIPRPATPLLVEVGKPPTSIMDTIEARQLENLEPGPLRESSRTGRFPCIVPGCYKSFCLRKDLQRHHKTIHAANKPEFCCPVPDCKRFVNGFTRKDNLKYHIMQLHIDPNAPCFGAMQKILKGL